MVKVFKSVLVLMVLAVSAQSIYAAPTVEPVGKIEDEFMVTPMGQANYEIPIKVLPGTGGVTPKLSVHYNSSTKTGLIGYGFDLKGLSIISRVPSNKFNDGQAGYVNFSSSDKFALDGVRLLQIGSSASVRDFSTENNTFSKITSYGAYEDPDSFVVRTKDGLKYLYLPNIRLLDALATKKSLFWMLARVEDTCGNYFTVSYSGDNDYHEIYPSRIDYTGNTAAQLSPYASVRFSYEETPDSANTYVYGNVVRRSKCVQQIGLYSGETLVRRFVFNYTYADNKKLLSQVKEIAADGNALKPTSIQWHTAGDLGFRLETYDQAPYVHKARLTVGDYNGDGKSDFVATPEDSDAGWNGWRLFLSTESGFALKPTGSFGVGELLDVVSGDFNGDGMDDLAVLREYYGIYTTYLLCSTGSGFQAEQQKYYSLNKYSIRTAEVNGDGIADLFVYFDNAFMCKTLSSNISLGLFPLSVEMTSNSPLIWDEVVLGDFNGDGLTDIYNTNDNGAYIMYGDGNGTFTNFLSVSPSKGYQKHFGDFNADGKTDILETSLNNLQWTYWWLFVSNGIGVYSDRYFDNMEDVRNKHFFVTDTNADGFEDCIGISMTNPSDGMVTPTVWLNDGTGRHFTPSSSSDNIYPLDKWHTYVGDFNGDGKGDLLCTSNWKDDDAWDGYRLYLMTTGSHLLLSSVTDGLGNTTEVAYKPMSNDSVHTRGTTASYPLSSFSSAWPLVCQVKTPDGLGGQRTTTYKYENALIHRGGRGILGFEKTFVTDESTNTTTTTEYAVEPVKYMMAPVRTQTKIGNRVIAETETQYNTLPAYSSVFAYHPVSTTERTYEYTSGSLLGETNTTYSYDDYGNVTQTTLATGNITTTTVNNYTNDTGRWLLGRLTSSTVTKSSPQGSETRHSEYQYNPYTGLLMIEQAEPQNAALGYTKTYQRDVFGNITQSTTTPNDATSARTDYTYYDAKGRYIAWCSNNLGHITVNTIDEDSGLLTAQEDANHVTTTYSYDSFGRQTQAATPITQTTTAMLWSTGDSDAPANALYCVETLTTGSPAKKEFFDCLGRSLRVVTENALGNKVYADVVYNAKGQVIKSSAPYFPGSTIPWTLTAYDAAGRVISKTTPAGATTAYSYNGYTTTTTDALNHHTARTIDAYGNLVTSTDHEGNTVDYEYDLNGHCTLVTGPRTTIRMEYDLMGNRTLLDDPDLGLVTSAYNAFGELTSQTDGKGTTTYHYDGLGRLVSEQRPDVTITTVYDTAYRGLPTSTATSDGNSTAYQYDAYGRTTQQTDVIGNKTFTTQTTYNNKNKVDVITYPSGLEVKHEYAVNGLLNAVKNVATNHCYWQLTGQDARGNVTQENFGNGLMTTRTYNAATGRLTAIATPGIQNWTYQYNAVGSLTHRTDNARNLTESFVYDNLDRLMMVRRNGQLTQQLTYDAAGNILSKMGVGTAFTYHDGTNRLTAYEAEGYAPVAWDSIHYTSFHKICYVSQGDKSLSISYGPAKSRVKAVQVNGQETTENYYVGGLYEETHTGATVRRLCYIFAGGKAIAIQETTDGNATVRYLHHDHLGSIQAYSDEQGTLVQELSYDAWGRRRHPDTWDYYASAVDAHAWQEWGFTGHEHIDLFEMVNMDGRMYDPVLGRFLTPDPYVQAPDHTQGLNRYTYCLNNPLSLTDPSGYSWLSDNWISVVASVVGIGVTVITAGAGATIGVVFLAGAAGGAASALTSALLNGANIGQVARATLSGAFWGGVSAFLANGSGDGTFLEKIFKHTFSQGWLEGVQGGNMFHGFMVGAVSGVGNYYIHNNLQPLGKAGKITASAILGGTVSEMGGGKFANGAITGAFNIMFNDMMHEMQSARRKYHDLIIHGRNKVRNRVNAMKRMIERSNYTGNEVCAAILEDGSVVIYHDIECTPGSSMAYYVEGIRNGERIEAYHNNGKYYIIKTYVHTHPYSGCDNNPLCVSSDDIRNANRFNGEINILLLNGDFYRQSTESVHSIYTPNYRGNIYDKTFSY